MEERRERLIQAASNGSMEEVERLLFQLNDNKKTELLTANNSEALRLSASNGRDNIFNSLIEAARGLTFRDEDGNDHNVLALMLNDSLRSAANNVHDNVFNSLINAAIGLTDQNVRNNIASILIAADNNYRVLREALQGQRFGAIDSILSVALDDDMQRNTLNIAIPKALERVIGRGSQINVNINGAGQTIRGRPFAPQNRDFLSFLAVLSNIPSQWHARDNQGNRINERNNLLNQINQQLTFHPLSNLPRYLRHFEGVFNNQLFNENTRNTQNSISISNNRLVRYLKRLTERLEKIIIPFNNRTQTPMIEQMRGLWHNIDKRYLNGEALEIIMNREAMEEAITSQTPLWDRGLNNEIISNFLPQDFNPAVLAALTDVNLTYINDANDRNLRMANNDNLRMIARMAGSPNLELSNSPQRDIARAEQQQQEILRQRQEAQPRNLGVDGIIDDTPLPSPRPTLARRFAGGARELASSIKESFGKCFGR